MGGLRSWASRSPTRRAPRATTQTNHESAREAGCDGDFASRDFAPNVSPMRGSTRAFLVPFRGLQRAAEVRGDGFPQLVAADGRANASDCAVADVATLLNRCFPTLLDRTEGAIVSPAFGGNRDKLSCAH